MTTQVQLTPIVLDALKRFADDRPSPEYIASALWRSDLQVVKVLLREMIANIDPKPL